MSDGGVSNDGSLSAAQLAQFREEGFLIVGRPIPWELIRKARDESDELLGRLPERQGGAFPAEVPAQLREMFWYQDMDGRSAPILWRIQSCFAFLPTSRALFSHPAVLGAAASILGPNIVCNSDSLVAKLPRIGVPVPWHQDPSHVFDTPEDRITLPAINLDIYFDDSDEENGCLYVVPGSHKRGNNILAEVRAAEGEDLPSKVTLRARAGDVVIHNGGILHGSGYNRSDRIRRTIYFGFLEADKVLRQRRADLPREMILHRMGLARKAIEWSKAAGYSTGTFAPCGGWEGGSEVVPEEWM